MAPGTRRHLEAYVEDRVRPEWREMFLEYAELNYHTDEEYWDRVGWDVMYGNFLTTYRLQLTKELS